MKPKVALIGAGAGAFICVLGILDLRQVREAWAHTTSHQYYAMNSGSLSLLGLLAVVAFGIAGVVGQIARKGERMRRPDRPVERIGAGARCSQILLGGRHRSLLSPVAISRVMPRFTRKQHRMRAAFGIVTGVLLAIVAAVASYSDYAPGKGTKWILLILPALALVAWGCSHLARHRGYPSAAGYGLLIMGFFAAGFIKGASTPFTVGFALVFVAVLPAVVLLALPIRPGFTDFD
jgi:hypothetical protein